MKKKVAVCLILLAMIVGILPLSVAAEAAPTITVYNWGQYISDGTDGYLDVIEEFTAATGIKVNYITYDSNESLYTKLKTGGTTYDVIIPSDYMIAKLIEEDMLEELNFDNIPNYQYIDDEFRNMEYDPQNKYSVPYTWGTVGIIYNKKYVDERPWQLGPAFGTRSIPARFSRLTTAAIPLPLPSPGWDMTSTPTTLPNCGHARIC